MKENFVCINKYYCGLPGLLPPKTTLQVEQLLGHK